MWQFTNSTKRNWSISYIFCAKFYFVIWEIELCVCITNIRSTKENVSKRVELIPSDQWIPTKAPPMPTVKPLNDFRPSEDMLNRPITRPLISLGAFNWTSVWAIDLYVRSKKPAKNRRPTEKYIFEDMAKPIIVMHQIKTK